MIAAVTAIRFDKIVGSGKTRPCILTCVGDDGHEVELVVKFAAGCEMKHRSLATEALAALLAGDLDLPVPEPFLVNICPDFAATIPNAEVKQRALDSLGWNFGSKKLPSGFATYPSEKPLPQALVATAAEVLAFDVFIANPDRTVANPNCLVRAKELAIYDHELAFFTEGLLGWKPPWVPGAIAFPKALPPKMRHLFLEDLRGQPLNFQRLAGAFDVITNERLAAYRQVLPETWLGDGIAVDRILAYIKQLKENLEQAINHLAGALR